MQAHLNDHLQGINGSTLTGYGSSGRTQMSGVLSTAFDSRLCLTVKICNRRLSAAPLACVCLLQVPYTQPERAAFIFKKWVSEGANEPDSVSILA